MTIIITHQDRRPAGREGESLTNGRRKGYPSIEFDSIQFHSIFSSFSSFFSSFFFFFSSSFILSYLSLLFSFKISFRRYAMKIVFLFFLICRSRCLFFNFFSFSFEKSSRCPPPASDVSKWSGFPTGRVGCLGMGRTGRAEIS